MCKREEKVNILRFSIKEIESQMSVRKNFNLQKLESQKEKTMILAQIEDSLIGFSGGQGLVEFELNKIYSTNNKYFKKQIKQAVEVLKNHLSLIEKEK